MAGSLESFIEHGRPRWTELTDLVSVSKGRVSRLSPHQVRDLGKLYRSATADLAVARRKYPGDPVAVQLDALVQKARPLVYANLGERESVLHFASTGYWRRIRERPAFLIAAAIALWLPALGVGLWSNANPTEAAKVAQISPLSAGLADGGPRDPDTQKVTDPEENAGFAATIFTNNARVALIAYAGGLTAGVLTIFSLVFNGALLGLVAGISVEGGNGNSLWRLVLPHGVLELSLITIAGAAGLRTGWALLHPGHRSRTEALATEGRAGVEMALGTAALLVPTGFVEGFITPRGLTMGPALAVGFGLGLAFWAMVVWRGSPPEAAVAAPAL